MSIIVLFGGMAVSDPTGIRHNSPTALSWLMAPRDAFDTGFGRFTDGELLSWFDHNVAGTGEFHVALELFNAVRRCSTQLVSDLDDALEGPISNFSKDGFVNSPARPSWCV